MIYEVKKMDNEKEPKQDQQPKSVLGKGLKKNDTTGFDAG